MGITEPPLEITDSLLPRVFSPYREEKDRLWADLLPLPEGEGILWRWLSFSSL